jgi:hypothetical protein
MVFGVYLYAIAEDIVSEDCNPVLDARLHKIERPEKHAESSLAEAHQTTLDRHPSK